MQQLFSGSVIFSWLGLAAALVCCFLGYRLQKAIVALSVFCAGFILMYRFGARFLPSAGAVFALALAIAFIAAALSYYLYLASMFLSAAVLSMMLCRIWITPAWAALLVGLLIGCALGALAVRWNRTVVIAVTGLAGGFTLARCGAQLLAAALLLQPLPRAAVLAAGAVLAVAGIVVQLRTAPAAEV